MADPIYIVIAAAAELKLAAPAEFDKFLTALHDYEEHCRDDLQAADGHVIYQAQGRAQAIAQLRQKLENCTQTTRKT